MTFLCKHWKNFWGFFAFWPLCWVSPSDCQEGRSKQDEFPWQHMQTKLKEIRSHRFLDVKQSVYGSLLCLQSLRELDHRFVEISWIFGWKGFVNSWLNYHPQISDDIPQVTFAWNFCLTPRSRLADHFFYITLWPHRPQTVCRLVYWSTLLS